MNHREPNELLLNAERPPLRVDAAGAVRIGNSRISLDLIVEQYENGMTPEDMVRAYDTLDLADVYAVIAYYLRHRAELGTYLKRRETEAYALRERIEAERHESRDKSWWPVVTPGRRRMLRLACDADVHGEIIRGLRC